LAELPAGQLLAAVIGRLRPRGRGCLHVRRLIPYRLAIFGAMLELVATRAERQAAARKSQERLKELLEQA
jgi:hypothetical protein